MLDWLTMGVVSGFAQGLGDRWEEMVQSPSLYHTANWLTLGFAGEVKGAVAPEEQRHFTGIEEDEPARFLLCNEYSAAK